MAQRQVHVLSNCCEAAAAPLCPRVAARLTISRRAQFENMARRGQDGRSMSGQGGVQLRDAGLAVVDSRCSPASTRVKPIQVRRPEPR
jgi:hypothetical protein